MKYVNYSKGKIDLAYELVKKRSSEEDIKASGDLWIIDKILAGYETCVNPFELDARLRAEYKTIEMMENIQMRFCYNDARSAASRIPMEEILRNKLILDRAGIIADILLKHGRIKCVDELYENKDNRNNVLDG